MLATVWLGLLAVIAPAPACEPTVRGADISALHNPPLRDYAAYEFLFVPGYLYDPFNDLSTGRLTGHLHIGEYFKDMRAALDADGVPQRLATMGTQDSIFDNAADLATIIAGMQGPVILVSHSKGGLETLEMLIAHPELRAKISLWISLQSPFYGSQIADVVYSHGPSRQAARHLLEDHLHGSLSSLEELQTTSRKEYMARNEAAIAALVQEMRIVSLGSTASLSSYTWQAGLPALWATAGIMQQIGAPLNDGLVALSSSLLPGSHRICVSEMDHADAVMPSPGRHFDRPGLLRMLLEPYHAQLVGPPRPDTPKWGMTSPSDIDTFLKNPKNASSLLSAVHGRHIQNSGYPAARRAAGRSRDCQPPVHVPARAHLDRPAPAAGGEQCARGPDPAAG